MYMAYFLLSLSLSLASYRAIEDKKEKQARKQLVIIFTQWAFCISALLLVGFSKIFWSAGDTVVTCLIVALSVGTIIWKGIKDDFTKAFLNVWCKSLPQIWLAYTFYLAKSGEGLHIIAILAGHATSVPRLIHVMISARAGWDDPTKALFIGDLANVATWTIVTIVWAYF